jgi:hypothetical protein
MSASTSPAVRPRPPATAPTGRNSRRRIVLTTIVVLVIVSAIAVTLRLTRGPGWQPVWSDDFDGADGAAPSARTWLLATGTGYPGGAPQWGTGEIQTYTTDPVNVGLDGDGHLRITPTRDSSGQWRSARLESRRADVQPAPGEKVKVAARIKVPNGGAGYWAAFWMLGAPFRPEHTDWPGAGEIDVMENIGSEPAVVHGTLHCGVFDGGPCRETEGLGGSHQAAEPLGGFHTYSVEWDRSSSTEEIRWYLDGARYHTVKATDVDQATWARATDHGFFVLLNVAVGGGWPGPPTAATKPGSSMLVDHVSVARQG